MSGTPIGELNGRWALLLKATLVAVPLVTSLVTAAFIPWSCWVTRNIYASIELTEAVEVLSSELRDINKEMDNLPPPEWKERIRKLEDSSIQNREDHLEIKLSLARISSKLGVADGP
jgi:hypothetical protein